MWKVKRLALTVLGALVVLSGCDSVVGLDGAPAGVALLAPNGAEVARYTSAGGGVSEGELVIPVGSTVRYRVVVLGGLGVEIDVDGQEYSIANPAVILPQVAQVRADGTDGIGITGLTRGATTLRFTLRRNGTTQFIADDIPVRVQS